MIIGVPKEIKLQEHRIGLTPESVKILTDKGHEVLIQANGGLHDISIIKVWALFGSDKYHNGTWGFFSPCIDAETNKYTIRLRRYFFVIFFANLKKEYH